MSDISNEWKFLLDALSGEIERSPSEHSELDSEELQSLIKQERLGAILAQAPTPAKAVLEKSGCSELVSRVAKHVAVDNLHKSGKLVAILNLFSDHGIEALNYKGASIATVAFGDISGREFTDLDILIKKSDRKRADELLSESGYSPMWDLTDKQKAAVYKHYYEFPYVSDDSQLLIEIHWGFVEPFFAFDPDLDKIWNRSIDTEVYGQKVRTLSLEDSLVVLSMHGSKHLWTRFGWIIDIDRLARNTGIDFKKAMEIAVESESEWLVLLGLGLARDSLSTPLPDHINDRIDSTPSVSKLIDHFLGRIFTNEHHTPVGWKEMARLHTGMREKKSTRIKYHYRLLKTKLIDSLFLPMGRPQ